MQPVAQEIQRDEETTINEKPKPKDKDNGRCTTIAIVCGECCRILTG